MCIGGGDRKKDSGADDSGGTKAATIGPQPSCLFPAKPQRCSHFPQAPPPTHTHSHTHPSSGNQTALTQPETTPNTHAATPQSRRVFSHRYDPEATTAASLQVHESAGVFRRWGGAGGLLLLTSGTV